MFRAGALRRSSQTIKKCAPFHAIAECIAELFCGSRWIPPGSMTPASTPTRAAKMLPPPLPGTMSRVSPRYQPVRSVEGERWFGRIARCRGDKAPTGVEHGAIGFNTRQ